MFQFYACIGVREVPIDLGLSVIPVILPQGDLGLHCFQIRYFPIQALDAQGTKFNLRHIEPTSMLRGVMDF